MNNRKLLTPLLLAAAAICGIYIGKLSSTVRQPKPTTQTQSDTAWQLPGDINANSNKLQTMLDIIRLFYVDKVETDTIIEKILPQLLEDLDPHSVYIPAKDFESVDQELKSDFGGIGVQFSILSDTINIVSVIAGGPSSVLGVMPGDKIIKVNGHDFVGEELNNQMVMDSLRGEIGTIVDITVLRGGESTIDYSVTRGLIPMTSVDAAYMIEPSVGYIKIDRFAERTYEEMVQNIAKLKSEGCQKLIVDLRGNSGGFLDVVNQMCNEFLPAGALIVYTEGAHQQRNEVRANGVGTCQDMQVVVMIDEYSASASEIFAGAMQDNDRGTIVGRRSFGKGLVQTQMPLGDGSAMRLTIARYHTPSGRCIQRPYGHGTAEYYSDLTTRYTNGELFDADSIKNDETQIYHTVGGRVVYGGGGIMPDIFVPRDSARASDYLYKLRAKALLYNFALEYANRHREAYSNLSIDQLINKLENDNLLSQLISYASRNGLQSTTLSTVERDIIECETQAYIARNLRDDNAFYRIINTADDGINAALKVLRAND